MRQILPKRYSFIVADRSSGVVHRFTLALRPMLALIAAILTVPIGWTAQSGWTAGTQIEHLQLRNAMLEVENARYRSATTELSDRIAALQLAIGELRDRSIVDPRIQRAMGRLPDTDPAHGTAALRAVALSSPTETFNLLEDLLNVLDVQLSFASDGVAQHQAFAAATPINLPAAGAVSGRYGYRPRPVQRQAHLPSGSRYLDWIRGTGLRDGGRHDRVRGAERRLRQPRRDRSRLRSGHAVRPPAEVCDHGRLRGEPGRCHRLHRRHRSRHRGPRPLRGLGERPRHEPATAGYRATVAVGELTPPRQHLAPVPAPVSR